MDLLADLLLQSHSAGAMTLSINGIKHNDTQHNDFEHDSIDCNVSVVMLDISIYYCLAVCHYAITLNIERLNPFMLNVIMLNVIVLCTLMPQ
jgi:hypothetical protein